MTAVIPIMIVLSTKKPQVQLAVLTMKDWSVTTTTPLMVKYTKQYLFNANKHLISVKDCESFKSDSNSSSKSNSSNEGSHSLCNDSSSSEG